MSFFTFILFLAIVVLILYVASLRRDLNDLESRMFNIESEMDLNIKPFIERGDFDAEALGKAAEAVSRPLNRRRWF